MQNTPPPVGGEVGGWVGQSGVGPLGCLAGSLGLGIGFGAMRGYFWEDRPVFGRVPPNLNVLGTLISPTSSLELLSHQHFTDPSSFWALSPWADTDSVAMSVFNGTHSGEKWRKKRAHKTRKQIKAPKFSICSLHLRRPEKDGPRRPYKGLEAQGGL